MRSSVAGVAFSKRFGLSSASQSGMSSSIAEGSMTLPLTMWSPSSPAFSKSRTRKSSLPASFASCLSLMAALRPAGPPPTMQTSTSSTSRSNVEGSKESSGVASRRCVVCVKARLWPAVTTAGLYPRTKHLEARPLPTEAGFAAANAREEAAGSWKARRLAVADSRAGTDMAAGRNGEARRGSER